MKIKEKTWQHRYDFDAIMKCEFCDNEQPLKSGYDDMNFHMNVIPAIKCMKCHKRTTEETLNKITDPGYTN
jgi:hypothetical protein